MGTIIITIIASSGVWSFLTAVFTMRKSNKDKMSSLLLAIARDRLLFLSKEYLRKGYIVEDELEMFLEMGIAYKNAGGNSIVKKLFDEASKLPTEIEKHRTEE